VDLSQLIPIDEVDDTHLLRYAWVTVSGITANSNQADGTFEVDASQYLSATKDMDAGSRPSFPVFANYDLASPRYKKKAPTVRNGRYVSLTGYLTRTIKDSTEKVQRFVIDIDHVVHLGSAPPPTAPAVSSGSGTFPHPHHTVQGSFPSQRLGQRYLAND